MDGSGEVKGSTLTPSVPGGQERASDSSRSQSGFWPTTRSRNCAPLLKQRMQRKGPQFRHMASSVPDAGNWLDDELTTAELPRMTATWPASTAPPPTRPAC